jgi:hypothetical protein
VPPVVNEVRHEVGDVDEVSFTVADDVIGDRDTAASRVTNVELLHTRILAQIPGVGNVQATPSAVQELQADVPARAGANTARDRARWTGPVFRNDP